jgi:hypothetical protein
VTGPEHYQEAERLLAVCAGDQRGSSLDAVCTAAAQVHATLALAAATALAPAMVPGTAVYDWHAWRKVAATKPDGEVPGA